MFVSRFQKFLVILYQCSWCIPSWVDANYNHSVQIIWLELLKFDDIENVKIIESTLINHGEVNATIQYTDANIMKLQKLNIIVAKSSILIFSSKIFFSFSSDNFATFFKNSMKPYSIKATKIGYWVPNIHISM